MFKLDLEKAEEPEICWIIEKARELQKTSTSAAWTALKPLTCVDHNKLWNILKEMGIPDHLICLLGNLCAVLEATVRTGHGTMGRFRIEKGALKGCVLSPRLLTCRGHHEERWAGWLTSWNQDCWEKYQKPQICRWYVFNDRNWKGNKEPLDEDEKEWKRQLKTQHSKREDYGIPVPSPHGK